MLLIGESGVGKSTWINAFANYCSFESLEEAVKAGGRFPIPFTFTVTDPQTKQRITISSGGTLLAETQTTKHGESVTQNPQEYSFRHVNTDTVIKLIDTPGLRDTSDAEAFTHDSYKQHIDNILKLLSAYQEIHAIFILMKANETRLRAALKYTLAESFKRLDKSACNNVVFIFTNAGSSNFKTDKTQPILHQFLTDKKLPIALPPDKPTIYCFENDTIKYIAECKNEMPHDEDDDEDAQRNWRRSVKITKELLDYLFSLKPHSLVIMISIHEATVMVSMMSKLLLDTMMCIFKDMDEIESKKNEAELLMKEITRNPGENTQLEIYKINPLLRITETKLVHQPLGHTNVVCESGRCAAVVEGHIVYPPDSGGIGIDSDEALKQINKGISQFENRVRECLDETEQMIDICAKLNAFAQQNALLWTSSTDDELLKCLENQQETYARSHNTSRQANDLARIKSQYERHLRKAKDGSYTVDDVPELIQQLCDLPMKGHEIKQAVDEYEKSRRMVIEESKKSKQHYVVKRLSDKFAGLF